MVQPLRVRGEQRDHDPEAHQVDEDSQEENDERRATERGWRHRARKSQRIRAVKRSERRRSRKFDVEPTHAAHDVARFADQRLAEPAIRRPGITLAQ